MIQESPRGVTLSLYIQPNASKNEIIGPHNGALKVKIKAPPVEGQANKELIHFLAKCLQVQKRQIEILRGESGRQKQVFIADVTAEQIRRQLGLS